MEQPRCIQRFGAHIVSSEGCVAAGGMNKHAIGTRWAEDNRIGTRLTPREDHVLRKPRPVRFEYLTYGLAEKIGADFSYQAGGDSQLMEGQPCIGDGAARRE